LGQAYNKKKILKIPLVYGKLWQLVLFYIDNNKNTINTETLTKVDLKDTPPMTSAFG
jgi:hypothetical protein